MAAAHNALWIATDTGVIVQYPFSTPAVVAEEQGNCVPPTISCKNALSRYSIIECSVRATIILYPIGRPVRATIILYPIGRPFRDTIRLYPIGRPVRIHYITLQVGR